MLTIHNKSRQVLMFNHKELPPLRIIPGYNFVDIDMDDLKKYSKGSKAASYLMTNHLTFPGREDLSTDDKEEAQKNSVTAKKLNENSAAMMAGIKKTAERAGEKTEGQQAKIDTLEKTVQDLLKWKAEQIEQTEKSDFPTKKKGNPPKV